MPDEATTRDIALKLEAWAASLEPDERQEVERWMALGVITDEPITRTHWWFDPSGNGRRAREAH